MSDGPYRVTKDGTTITNGTTTGLRFDMTAPHVVERVAGNLNDAYSKGRASRDNLRKAVEKCLEWGSVEIDGKKLEVDFLRQALNDDALGEK